jgi:hypothetical protein
MSRRVLVVSIWIAVTACMPFPRYAYVAETRVEVGAGSREFSAAEIERAKAVASDVATEIGMQSEVQRDDDLRLQKLVSASKEPPRQFLSAYYSETTWGRPITFRLELSEDGRVLHYTVSDYERGTPTPIVTRVRASMIEQVDAAFPDGSIVHEAEKLGPFFDSLLDSHHAVQPPSTGMIAPVT